MSTELERSQRAQPVVSEEQKRSRVYQHPDRDQIHALLRRGKSASWISLWLEDEYPTEDEEGNPHEDARKHKRLQLSERVISRYRRTFMPETSEGIDSLSPELEDLIGRTPPRPVQHEIEVMEAGIKVAETNLVRALEQDEEMGMLQPTTITAHQALMGAAKETIEAKGKLGVPGYEFVAEKQEILQHNSNLSVTLHGRTDPRTGKPIPVDPERVEIARELMGRSPQEALAMVGQMKAEAERRALAAGSVPGSGTEVPTDEALDGTAQGEPETA